MSELLKVNYKIMKTLSLLPILLSLILLSGCDDINTSYTETEFVPGEIWVLFSNHVTLQEGHEFVQEVSLSPIDLSSLESDIEQNWCLVRVPEGEEEYWTKMLNHYPIVNGTKRNTREVN